MSWLVGSVDDPPSIGVAFLLPVGCFPVAAASSAGATFHFQFQLWPPVDGPRLFRVPSTSFSGDFPPAPDGCVLRVHSLRSLIAIENETINFKCHCRIDVLLRGSALNSIKVERYKNDRCTNYRSNIHNSECNFEMSSTKFAGQKMK